MNASNSSLVLATRKSPLALKQADLVASLIRKVMKERCRTFSHVHDGRQASGMVSSG